MLACMSLAGCKVYDDKLLDARAGTGGSTEAGVAGNGDGDGGTDACVASAEICNDRDDDCNGVVDDDDPTNEDCSTRYHANVTCGRGVCLFVAANPMCYPGWFHCDGLPETGCEANEPCCPGSGCEDDAGMPDDDAG
jgi:hypothetical protein